MHDEIFKIDIKLLLKLSFEDILLMNNRYVQSLNWMKER